MKNILPEDVPELTEPECTLINLYRAFSPAKQSAILKAVFQAALAEHGKGEAGEKKGKCGP